jgi:galactokinase
MNTGLLASLSAQFRNSFHVAPTISAYAPGRVEVLGNHTDYNEGYVLSAAINFGTFFMAAPAPAATCRLVAGDLMTEAQFDAASPVPVRDNFWANYVIGVLAGLGAGHGFRKGFLGMFLGDVPLGAGLSSSAALEMSSALALSALYGIETDKLQLAKIGQAAEHKFAGVKCGLLDQISSLFGCANALVMSDFRTLEVGNVPLGADACFLMCNTKAKHNLADGAYNERRQKCEEAAAFFAKVLPHPVTALRDVSWAEWERFAPQMDPLAARRAAHPIGENERVLKGRDLLAQGRLEEFGKLMFESHESSRRYFDNSCPELDFLVDAAARIPGVLGARLSGGGFGGSAVMLTHPRDSEVIGHALNKAYARQFGHACDIRAITPSDGARVMVVGCR